MMQSLGALAVLFSLFTVLCAQGDSIFTDDDEIALTEQPFTDITDILVDFTTENAAFSTSVISNSSETSSTIHTESSTINTTSISIDTTEAQSFLTDDVSTDLPELEDATTAFHLTTEITPSDNSSTDQSSPTEEMSTQGPGFFYLTLQIEISSSVPPPSHVLSFSQFIVKTDLTDAAQLFIKSTLDTLFLPITTLLSPRVKSIEFERGSVWAICQIEAQDYPALNQLEDELKSFTNPHSLHLTYNITLLMHTIILTSSFPQSLTEAFADPNAPLAIPEIIVCLSALMCLLLITTFALLIAYKRARGRRNYNVEQRRVDEADIRLQQVIPLEHLQAGRIPRATTVSVVTSRGNRYEIYGTTERRGMNLNVQETEVVEERRIAVDENNQFYNANYAETLPDY